MILFFVDLFLHKTLATRETYMLYLPLAVVDERWLQECQWYSGEGGAGHQQIDPGSCRGIFSAHPTEHNYLSTVLVHICLFLILKWVCAFVLLSVCLISFFFFFYHTFVILFGQIHLSISSTLRWNWMRWAVRAARNWRACSPWRLMNYWKGMCTHVCAYAYICVFLCMHICAMRVRVCGFADVLVPCMQRGTVI